MEVKNILSGAVKDYISIKEKIPDMLQLSGYRNDYIAKKIGISPAAFAVKKQRKSWSDDEVKDIIGVITNPNEELEDYILAEIMRNREEAEQDVSMEAYKKYKKEWL